MNDPHENLPDELLENLLQPLRDIEVPAEAQSSNRSAVRQALATRARPAWWQRTIAVPVPVAIAASIVLLLAAASIVRPSATGHATDQPSPSVAVQQANHAQPETTPASHETAVPTWTVQRSFIRTLTSSTASGFVATHAMENRDDS